MNQMKGYGSAWSNWAILLQQEVAGVYEVAITAPSASGSELDKLRRELDQAYVPNKIVLGGASGTLPLLEGKFPSEPMLYVCRNKACSQPVKDMSRALAQLTGKGLPRSDARRVGKERVRSGNL